MVYGRYIGYIFQDQSSFFGLLGLSVIAGVFCGIATALSGNVLKMYETPTITGNTTLTLIDTKHGNALKVSEMDRETEIRTQQKHGIKRGFGKDEKFLKDFSISMSNFTLYENNTSSQMIDVWVYSKDNSKNCFIDFNVDTGCGQIMSINNRDDQEIRKGWQKVKFSRIIYLNCD